MKTQNIVVSVVAMFAFVMLLASQASAFVDSMSVTVNGIEMFGDDSVAGVFAGETIPVRVIFTAGELEEDVRVIARIIGESGTFESTERFDVINGSQYSRLLNIRMPFDIDPDERYVLRISVESNSDVGAEREIELQVQRESYLTEVLSVESPDTIVAGSILALDVVLKNRGRQEAEDNFVTVRIPSLGLSRTVYFGDLTPEDQDDPDKEDAVERRVLLEIPASTPEGVYTVEVEAKNSDSTTVRTKRVLVESSQHNTGIFPSSNSRTFSPGEEASYTLTLVNSGDSIQVYQLSTESSPGLTVDLDESVVAVPAGSSRTVRIMASAQSAGNYDFTVNVQSGGQVVRRENFSANVEGTRIAAGNAAVLLTVVLAIIFVVLLVVLIVLLTRKPEKTENFGESYY